MFLLLIISTSEYMDVGTREYEGVENDMDLSDCIEITEGMYKLYYHTIIAPFQLCIFNSSFQLL